MGWRGYIHGGHHCRSGPVSAHLSTAAHGLTFRMSTVRKEQSTVQRGLHDAASAAPAYQHRHRPDPPKSTNAAQTSRKYDPDAAARRKAAMAGLLENDSAEKASMEHDAGVGKGDTSAGSSGQTLPDARPPVRPVGGFSHGEAVSQGRSIRPNHSEQARLASTGASARAQALAHMSAPPRAGSPRIPSGGIDQVAARASPQFAQRAAALGLHDDIQTENPVGFSSARGMKRVTSDGQT